MLIKSILQKRKNSILWILIIIPYLLLIPATVWYYHTLNSIENSSFIVINKADLTLTLYNYKGEVLQKSKIAIGKKPGNKSAKSDYKTPEGIFNIVDVEDASKWSHDFKDDSLGAIPGAYGPYFIRLNVPGQKGIGIHGTHDNNSLGTRASEGCIRMNNNELLQLVKNVTTASVVVITPGAEDVAANMQNDSASKVKQQKTRHCSGF